MSLEVTQDDDYGNRVVVITCEATKENVKFAFILADKLSKNKNPVVETEGVNLSQIVEHSLLDNDEIPDDLATELSHFANFGEIQRICSESFNEFANIGEGPQNCGTVDIRKFNREICENNDPATQKYFEMNDGEICAIVIKNIGYEREGEENYGEDPDSEDAVED